MAGAGSARRHSGQSPQKGYRMDNLLNILRVQKEAIADLEREVNLIKNSDLTKENESLKSELSALKLEYQNNKELYKKAREENSGLKNALYGQIYNEKISILNISRQKLDIYFGKSYETGMNRLTMLENHIRHRIEKMTMQLNDSHIALTDEIYTELNGLNQKLNERVAVAKYEYSKVNGAFTERDNQEFSEMKEAHLSNGQINQLAKKNNLEAFIGKNLINKLGVLLIIIGVIAASQFTFLKLTDELKGICIFLLGGLMLVAGEFLNRKKANVFSLGITAGGVAVLYVAAATGYFYLKILGDYPAIAVIVLITAVAFILSIRYNASVITAFALIGGYLPLLSISGNLTMIYGAMVYFLILNLFALFISFNKKWTVCSFIGLFLNIAGTCYIVFLRTGQINKPIAIGYIVLTFLVYSLIPIISTCKTTRKFKYSDIILLAINTFFSAIIMYVSFDVFNFDKYNGLLAIIFAVTYLGLGRFIETKFKNEKNATALFYLTGFAFSVLIIPFQFGKEWLSLGWLVEGVALSVYGILAKEKVFRRAGHFINVLCLAAFLFFDVLIYQDSLFFYKYMALTLGSIVILTAYIMKKRRVSIYKSAVIVNLWFYMLYVVNKIDTPEFLTNFLMLIFTYLLAYACTRIKRLADYGTRVISIVLSVFSIIFAIYVNGISDYGIFRYTGLQPKTSLMVFGIITLVLSNIVALLALRGVLKTFIVDKRFSIEWYPLMLSAFFVFLLTQNLVVQYDLGFSSIILSMIYAVTSVLWIIFGFAKRYAYLRRFGLALSLLSVVKLFLIDLHSLEKGGQIASYFALGISMLAISFIYQYFSKKIEGSVVSDD